LYALGLAAAITLGGAMTADAQAGKKPTPRATRRAPVKRAKPATQIPVTKEVTAAKVDTVIVTRVDTVTLRRIDTVATTLRLTDTVTRMVYPPLAKLPGLFFGIGAGANIAMNDIRAVLKDGPAGQLQVGFFPENSPLGARIDGTYGKLGCRDKDFGSACKDPKLWTIGGDVILRLPIDRTSKLNPVLYVFGGGGWANFSDVQTGGYPRNPFPLPVGGGKFLNPSGGQGYWDVGPGVDFSLGGLHLYAEGKYMTIMTSGKNTHLFPVYGGLKFY
jgi:hypothetical protein